MPAREQPPAAVRRLASLLREAHYRASGLRRLQDYWNRQGRDDPMYAVLTRPEKWDEEEFFATGAAEIADVMEYVDSVGVPVSRDRALDFGCGLGRLTRPLARHFDQVVGVDIAESMVEAARRLNESIPNCEFLHNPRPDLAVFDSGSFNFVYSNITLQHMAPPLAKGYLAELVRILSADGLLLFQLTAGETSEDQPATSNGIRSKIWRLRSVASAKAGRRVRRAVQMYYVPKDEVIGCLESAGGRPLEVQADDFAPGFESYRYAVVRVERP